jgi:hypothetical protein
LSLGTIAYTTYPIVVGELFSAGKSTGFKFYKKIDGPERQLKIELRMGGSLVQGCQIFSWYIMPREKYSK